MALRIGTRFDHEVTLSIDIYAYYNAFFTDEADGSVPKKDDARLVLGLGWSF